MNVTQVIPVSGQWYAHMYNNKNDIDLTWPIVCWGFTDSEDVAKRVCGMVVWSQFIMAAPDVPVVDKIIDFLGYVNQETVDFWKADKDALTLLSEQGEGAG